MKTWYIWYGLLGTGGFVDALYLTFSHYRQHELGCSILTGCDEVLTSEYSTVGGIPLALLGIVYYLFLLAGTLLWYQMRSRFIFNSIRVINGVGFLTSLLLTYVQWTVIGAFCQYCILSAIITTVMFALVLFARTTD
jgi:uncharacterized membrane protein